MNFVAKVTEAPILLPSISCTEIDKRASLFVKFSKFNKNPDQLSSIAVGNSEFAPFELERKVDVSSCSYARSSDNKFSELENSVCNPVYTCTIITSFRSSPKLKVAQFNVMTLLSLPHQQCSEASALYGK